MMNKRLYKKPAFVTALLLIIVMTVIILFSSNDGGRVVSITLCAENSNDTVATDIIKELTSEKALLNSAQQAVKNRRTVMLKTVYPTLAGFLRTIQKKV